MDIAIHLGYLLIILALIVFVCVVFTNAVEHLGEELNLSQGAVGSVLAAVGTALPETIVPLVAIVGGMIAGADPHLGHEIGIGAILGAPFMLGTLAMFVTGVAVYAYTRMGKRTLHMPVNTPLMFRDIKYFFVAYFIAVASSFIPNMTIKYCVAASLLVIYGVYVFQTVRTPCLECEDEEELCQLYSVNVIRTKKFFRAQVFVQLILTLIAIVVLAYYFVENIKYVAEVFQINPLILSLIIAPIATELPEKFNSVIWIGARKDTLAMGNITGAMVFQSCIPPAIGICLTPWVLNTESIVNVVVVYSSMALIYLNLVRNKGVLTPNVLVYGGAFYLLFLVYVFTLV